MKFTVEKNKLVNCLNYLPVISNDTNPILNTILIEADSELILSATDSTMATQITLEANIQNSGRTCVLARNLIPIIKEMPSRKLEIELINNKLMISTKRIKAELEIMESEKFPKIEKINSIYSLRINSDKLFRKLKLTSFCVGVTEGLQVNALLFNFVKDDLSLVGSDGERLIVVDKVEQPEFQALVPKRAVRELEKIIKDTNEDLLIDVSRNELSFTISGTYLTTQLCVGAYPDEKELIPEGIGNKAIVNREKLLSALKRANLVSQDEMDFSIRLQFIKDKLIVSSSSDYIGNLREELEVGYSENNIVVNIKAAYLLEVLEVMSDVDVEIQLTEKSNMLVIQNNNLSYLCLLKG